MVDFSIFSNKDKPSATTGFLTRRRRLFRLRRTGAALALGLAVFCTLQILLQAQGRLSVLVAARPIARGSAIEPGMVETRILHGRERLPGLISSFGQVRGRRLMISIHTGQPLTTAMISSRPAQPPGTTPVTVRLADDPGDLQAGDQASLLASGDCPAGAGPHHAQTGSLPPASGQASGGGRCMIAEQALALQPAQTIAKDRSGLEGREGDQVRQSSQAVFALDASQALLLLSLDPSTPVIAIRPDRVSVPTPSNHVGKPKPYWARDNGVRSRHGLSMPHISYGRMDNGLNQSGGGQGYRRSSPQNLANQQQGRPGRVQAVHLPRFHGGYGRRCGYGFGGDQRGQRHRQQSDQPRTRPFSCSVRSPTTFTSQRAQTVKRLEPNCPRARTRTGRQSPRSLGKSPQ